MAAIVSQEGRRKAAKGSGKIGPERLVGAYVAAAMYQFSGRRTAMHSQLREKRAGAVR
jgi:hypothetical protein